MALENETLDIPVPESYLVKDAKNENQKYISSVVKFCCYKAFCQIAHLFTVKTTKRTQNLQGFVSHREKESSKFNFKFMSKNRIKLPDSAQETSFTALESLGKGPSRKKKR